MNYGWIKAEQAHIAEIAARCRPADVAELWASDRSTPAEALQKGLDTASAAWTGVVDGEPICMFGVTPWSILGAAGAPWMIGTTLIKPNARPFLKESRRALEAMKEPYDLLLNFVDARHHEAVRWLRWLGFTIQEPVPYGPDGMPFHPFEWRRV